MSNQDEKLKDALLQVEGESLLNAVRQQAQPAATAPCLVDPTGAPLGKTEDEKPKVEFSPEALREALQKQTEERRVGNAKLLSGIFDENLKQSKVRDLMCLAHKILMWCRMEMAGHPDITDEMIEDLDHILQHQIYANPKGFDFRTLVSQLKNYGIKTMQEFERDYADAARVRRMQIEKVKKRIGKDGLALPPDMRAILGKNFGPGMTFILRGDKGSTQAALQYLLGAFHPALDQVYLAQRENGHTPFGHVTPMQPAWWADAASKLSTLNAAFEPVLKADSLLLAIEDVDMLFTSDVNADPLMRKQLSIKRVYQWAVENMVAVILCDNDTAVVQHERPYGFIPYTQVSKNGKVLSIGKDTFDIEEN